MKKLAILIFLLSFSQIVFAEEEIIIYCDGVVDPISIQSTAISDDSIECVSPGAGTGPVGPGVGGPGVGGGTGGDGGDAGASGAPAPGEGEEEDEETPTRAKCIELSGVLKNVCTGNVLNINVTAVTGCQYNFFGTYQRCVELADRQMVTSLHQCTTDHSARVYLCPAE